VSLKLLYRTVAIRVSNRRVFRIRSYKVPSLLQFKRAVYRIDLDLSADALCALSPFEFDRVETVL
jgi:hypothetical protein